MNRETISLLRLVGVTVAIFILISFSLSSGTSDIHINDTYLIMSSVTRFLLFVVLSAFIGSLIVSLLSKFKNKLYVKILIFSTLLLFSSGIYLFSYFIKPH